jgi:hypothetical protein
MTIRRLPQSWWKPLVLFLFFGLVFARFLDHTIVYKDSFHFFAPNKHLIIQALRQATIYEWNPWQWLGLPFVAEVQAGWFYPANLLFLVFSFGVAHRLYILLHYPLSAGSMYLFLRGRGWREEACLVGAVVFPLSGYLVSQHGPVRMLRGGAWAPRVFFFRGQALAGRPQQVLAAGAVLAMQVLAGDPETASITAAASVIWIAASAWERRSGRSLGLAVLLALALVALTRVRLPSFRDNPTAILAGALDPAANALFLMSSHYTRLDVAAVLASLYPMGTVVLSRLVLKEHIVGLQWVGVTLCMAAVALITL